jgi:hypothetical protein
VAATPSHRAPVYSGWGLFRADFLSPPPGNRLEVRVWSAGGGTVNVYSAELVSEGRSASSRPGRIGSEGG